MGTLSYQFFSPYSEQKSLLTYQATKKRLEMNRSNSSQLFKEPVNISSTQNSFEKKRRENEGYCVYD